MSRWLLLKDILLTGTGLFLVLSQALAQSPSDVLIATGMWLTGWAAAGHVKTLISGTGGPSSPAPSPSGQSDSGPSSPDADDD
jgi:hypothetical protein